MKKVVILLVSVFLFVMMSLMVSGVCTGTCGDNNGDNFVNVLDAQRASVYASGSPVQGVSFNVGCADVVDPVGVNILDVQRVAQYSAGIQVTLNCNRGGPIISPVPGGGGASVQCTDTQDNDRDGYADARDPACGLTGGRRIDIATDTNEAEPSCGDGITDSFHSPEQCDPTSTGKCRYVMNDRGEMTGLIDCCSIGVSRCARTYGMARSQWPNTASCQCVGTEEKRSSATDVMNPPFPSGVSSIATMLVLFGLLVSLIFLFKRD